MNLVFILEIVSLKIRQKWGIKITCASSCNHKSTYFVIFVFIHLPCFSLKGNSSYFEISYFWKIFNSYISVEIVWEIISMCMLNNARLIVLIRGNIDPKAFCCKSDSDLLTFADDDWCRKMICLTSVKIKNLFFET